MRMEVIFFLLLWPHRRPRRGQDRPGTDLPQRRSPFPEELHPGEMWAFRPGRGVKSSDQRTLRD